MAIAFDSMLVIALAAFAWGLSLVTYRWFALHNGWPMGAWQATMPALPRGIGLAAIAVATVFALRHGIGTALVLALLGLAGALAWTLILRVGAQSALLLAPIATALVVVGWRLGGA